MILARKFGGNNAAVAMKGEMQAGSIRYSPAVMMFMARAAGFNDSGKEIWQQQCCSCDEEGHDGFVNFRSLRLRPSFAVMMFMARASGLNDVGKEI